MKTYRNHRAEPYFSFLKNGQKTIEGRLRKGKYSEMRPGDHIVVSNNEETDSVETEALRVTKYSSLKEMLEQEDLQSVLPDAKSLEQGVEIYRQFYTPEQEKEFGVVAIEVRLV